MVDAQVEGLKVVAFGPFDLSVAMGFDGVRTPEVCAHGIDSVRGEGGGRERAQEQGKGERVGLRAVACGADSKEEDRPPAGQLVPLHPPSTPALEPLAGEMQLERR